MAGFSAVTALGVLLSAFSPLRNPAELLAGGVALLALAAAALLAPWRRLPDWAPAAVPIAYYGVFAILRDGTGGSRTLMTPLLVLPLMWLALYGTPRQLLLGVGALLATVALPMFVIGGPEYPADGWRNAVLWAAVAPLIGFTVQWLVAAQRRTERDLAAQTDRLRERESEVLAARDLFSGVLAAASEHSIISTDEHGTITVFNEGAERLLGYRAEELVGVHTPTLIHDAIEVEGLASELGLEPGFDVFVAAARAGRSETREWTYVCKDGDGVPVSVTVSPILADGSPKGFIWIATDLRRQRRAEIALRASEERHRLLVQNLPDAMISLYDRELRCELAEGSLLQSPGAGAESAGDALARDVLSTDSFPELEPALHAALDGDSSSIEYSHPEAGRTFSVAVAPYRLEDGTIDGAFTLWREVTERRQAELDLAAAEEHFRGAFEQAPVGMAISSPDGRVLDVNLALTALLGLSRSELLGLRWDDITHPDDLDAGEVSVGASGDGAQYEKRYRRSDGSFAHVAVRTTVVRDAAGRPSRVLAHITNIEERQRAERCRDAQLALTSVLAASRTEEEALAGVLPAIGTALGWEAGDCWLPGDDAGLSCVQFWAADGVDADRLAHASAGPGAGSGLPTVVWENARPHWIEDVRLALISPRAREAAGAGWRSAIGLPLRAEGRLVGVLELFSREVRRPDHMLLEMIGSIGSQLGEFIQRKRAERSAEQLKDEFFAVVSHELRTPLTSVVGYVEVLLDDDDLDPTQRRFLSVVERNAQRLVRLVGDLLFVAQVESGKARLEPAEMDLATVAWEAVESAQPSALASGIELGLDCPPLAPVHGDPHRIAQSLDNLISNAIKFTPEGGRVEVRVRRSSGTATVEVQDSGIGIPLREQGRLFERFFRASTATDREIPGVGLGLTIVKAIVEGHGGKLGLVSEEGAGTTFRLELPTGQPAVLQLAA